jgi:serpin B
MKIRAFFSFCILILLFGCNHTTEPLSTEDQSPPLELTTTERSVIASGNSFGFNLFTKVSNSEPGKNVFISPFSVSMAFGMVLNGANGPTLDSLKKVLDHARVSLEDINNSYKNISCKT